MRRRARSTSILRTGLPQFDELELPGRGDGIEVGASVDYGALTSEDRLAGAGRDQRTSDSVSAIDRDCGVERVDRGHDVDRRVERPLGCRVVSASGRVRLPATIF